MIAGTQQCDDGNNVDGDGCNADCTIGNNNSCPATTPYRDPVTTLCTATCSSGYYSNPTLFSCIACSYTCATCTTASTCDSCPTTSNRVLTSGQCVPASGFYDNSVTNALPCVSPCLTCTSATACITCVTGYYISSTTCTLCSTAMTFCSTCSSSTVCTTCQLGYINNATTNGCSVSPCVDPNCISCPVSTSAC